MEKADVNFPSLTLLQLISRYRRVGELKAVYPDCLVPDEQAKFLVTTFPKQQSLILPIDEGRDRISIMKRWYFWVGVIISAAFLFFALRGLQLQNIWGVIRSADPIWVIPGIFVYFIAVWFRSWRWHYLVKPMAAIPTKNIFPVVSIGYMGNNIYPARAGELLRAILLKRKHSISISGSLATILTERIFDGIIILGFIFTNLPNINAKSGRFDSSDGFQPLALWGAVAFLSAFVIFLAAAIFPQQAEKFLSKIVNLIIPLKWRVKTMRVINRFIEGLASLRSPRDVLMILGNSVIIWLLETGVYWFIMQAFPFRVSITTLLFMNGVVNLATTLPSAPGYIGTFDAPGIALLAASGVDQTIAAGYTLTLHAVLWLPVTLLGGFFFAKEGMDWSKELEKAKIERKEQP